MIIGILLTISLVLNVICIASIDVLYKLRDADFKLMLKHSQQINDLEDKVLTMQIEDIAYLRKRVTEND